jgi:hypothetical protein
MKVRVWDFDNVLFLNNKNNYTDEFLTFDKITTKGILLEYHIQFSNKHKNILMTGRGFFQKNKILMMLRKAGYTFDFTIFFLKRRSQYPSYNKNVNVNQYYQSYYTFKKGWLIKLNKMYGDIEVIDDDKRIIEIANNLNLRCRYIDVRKRP